MLDNSCIRKFQVENHI
uniref:Uncharacterized protein n=1 Tax=Anguilla anguilla TaxID=7936 RepID=A0A0E9UQV5_ANGAN